MVFGLLLLIVGIMALLTVRDEMRDTLPGRLQPLLPAPRAARQGRAGRLSMPSLLRLLERIERSPGYQRLATSRLTRRGTDLWRRAGKSVRVGPGRHVRALRVWLVRRTRALRGWLVRVGLVRATERPAEPAEPAERRPRAARPPTRKSGTRGPKPGTRGGASGSGTERAEHHTLIDDQRPDQQRPEDQQQVWVGRATVADPAAPAAPAAPPDPTGRTAVGRARVPDPEAAAPEHPKRAPR